jgi:hypothetical protein
VTPGNPTRHRLISTRTISSRDHTATLTQDEATELLAPVGEGGQQGFHEWIINQLQGGNLAIAFDDDQLGKLIRYMTQYGRGGFQGRLQKAFRRPLRDLIAA